MIVDQNLIQMNHICGQLSETVRLSRSGCGLVQVFNYVFRQLMYAGHVFEYLDKLGLM